MGSEPVELYCKARVGSIRKIRLYPGGTAGAEDRNFLSFLKGMAAAGPERLDIT